MLESWLFNQIIDHTRMQLPLQQQISGHFRLEVISKEGGNVVQTPENARGITFYLCKGICLVLVEVKRDTPGGQGYVFRRFAKAWKLALTN